MNTPPRPPGVSLRDRFQWAMYGALVGLIVGIIVGWVFSTIVDWVFRFGIALVVVVALVLAFMVWRWVASREIQATVATYQYPQPAAPANSIEASARVVENQAGDANR